MRFAEVSNLRPLTGFSRQHVDSSLTAVENMNPTYPKVKRGCPHLAARAGLLSDHIALLRGFELTSGRSYYALTCILGVL